MCVRKDAPGFFICVRKDAPGLFYVRVCWGVKTKNMRRMLK